VRYFNVAFIMVIMDVSDITNIKVIAVINATVDNGGIVDILEIQRWAAAI
jgi:hypothetical protein